jgi:NhaP-type Na+/H+ or K+/H+ antiporter
MEAALLAAILTPTDAALGAALVSNPRVPVRIRQALNVESGLNNGLMLPIITMLLAFAATEESLEPSGFWI